MASGATRRRRCAVRAPSSPPEIAPQQPDAIHGKAPELVFGKRLQMLRGKRPDLRNTLFPGLYVLMLELRGLRSRGSAHGDRGEQGRPRQDDSHTRTHEAGGKRPAHRQTAGIGCSFFSGWTRGTDFSAGSAPSSELPAAFTIPRPLGTTPALPHSRTPALPHSRTAALPHCRTAALPHCRTTHRRTALQSALTSATSFSMDFFASPKSMAVRGW